jgi:type I restriction enzyme S subunit
MNTDANALPLSWSLVRLDELVADPKSDIVDGPFGSNLKASEYIDEGTPIIRLQNIAPAQFVEKNIRFVSADKASSLARHSYVPGDLVVTKLGNPLGEACIVPSDFPPGIIVADIVRIRLHPSVNTSAVMYAINSSRVQDEFKRLTKGTTRPRVNLQHVRAMHVPIPPREEQDRLVDEIEKQFSRLDAATAALKKVQANLKRYRASVLKAACEGRLVPTEAELARKEGREYEPAATLLERILRERRARWEADTHAKMIASGKPPKEDGWKRKYKEPSGPDIAKLPPLPIGWRWVALDQLIMSGPQNGLYKPAGSYGAGVPIVRIDDFQNDWHRSLGDLKCLRLSDDEHHTYRLEQDDILINRVNSPSHLAKSVAVPTEWSGAVFESNMMRFQVASFISIPWLLAYLYSYEGKSRLTSNAKWAVNQASINQDDVRNTPVPLAPYGEQVRIAERISTLLAQTGRTVEQLSAQLSRASRLRQSVLKAAFCGMLLAQDPADEPASVLLERIRAERATPASKTSRNFR